MTKTPIARIVLCINCTTTIMQQEKMMTLIPKELKFYALNWGNKKTFSSPVRKTLTQIEGKLSRLMMKTTLITTLSNLQTRKKAKFYLTTLSKFAYLPLNLQRKGEEITRILAKQTGKTKIINKRSS